ncbi:hypothetical protein ACOBQX_08080 [Actinokineospora sp. G85]|uniref:hypothetical protein n=1 Tax=Actinokineospora sp. G85 TaxID=3406626 RepID=UPI003C769A91
MQGRRPRPRPRRPEDLARDIWHLERELGQRFVHRCAASDRITTLTDHGHALATTIATLERTPDLARSELPNAISGR